MPMNEGSVGLANFAFVKPKEKAKITGVTRNSSIIETAGKTKRKPALADLDFRLCPRSFRFKLLRDTKEIPLNKCPGGAVKTTPPGLNLDA